MRATRIIPQECLQAVLNQISVLAMTTFLMSALSSLAQDRLPSSVGVSGRLEQIVIPGSELEAKPIQDRKTPLVLRVLQAYRHGSDYRYDMEYYGLEPGRYDVKDYLQRKDHSSMESVPSLPVEIKGRLAPGQLMPSELVSHKLPYVGGYRIAACVVIALWLLITLWLLLGGRRKKQIAAVAEHIPTMAERLRPLVQEAIAGRLNPEGQAELERLMLGYWRGRLGLVDTDPVIALNEIREHPEAGRLLRLIEDWLHRPGGAGEIDIAAVLAPYQNLPDESDTVSTSQKVQSVLATVTASEET